MKHTYININIKTDKDFIDKQATKYISTRGGLHPTFNKDLFQETEFDVTKLMSIIQKNTLPDRLNNIKEHLGIYRSDLGELLMTSFFEDDLTKNSTEKNNFIIPLKNIWDRETNNQPGRGIDAIGYRIADNGKLTLFLGEAKVSSDRKNPPNVVHGSHDSIYKTHVKHATDKDYLLKKLSNHCKKIHSVHAQYLYMIIMHIVDDESSLYDVAYGCCMVRDNTCFNVDKDFGKLKSGKKKFDPNFVYFYIPIFDRKIEDVVQDFSQEINNRF